MHQDQKTAFKATDFYYVGKQNPIEFKIGNAYSYQVSGDKVAQKMLLLCRFNLRTLQNVGEVIFVKSHNSNGKFYSNGQQTDVLGCITPEVQPDLSLLYRQDGMAGDHCALDPLAQNFLIGFTDGSNNTITFPNDFVIQLSLVDSN